MNILNVVLKTCERCNLNCKYCYFFNRGEESYKDHPAFMSLETLKQVLKFLKQGIKDKDIQEIAISFHGGEPTLQPLKHFDSFCSTIQDQLSDLVKIHLSIQTNGTLINEEWIDIFTKYDVSVGVSLDGPQSYNDEYRIDHRGHGSYEMVKKGIEKLKKAFTEGKSKKDIGILCVIDPKRDARVIYRHFVDELNVNFLDFLLPDFTHDDFDHNSVSMYSNYLCNLLEEWIKDDNPQIKIRILEEIFLALLGRQKVFCHLDSQLHKYYLLTISSNGEISPDDTLRVAGKGKLMQLSNVWDTSFVDFFEFPTNKAIQSSKNQLPEKCKNCCWQNICGGGSYLHRYSQKNGFANPSIMCEALKNIYSMAAVLLLKNGHSLESLQKTLLLPKP